MDRTARRRGNSIAGLSGDALSSLFQAIGGVRNQRALAALFGCLFIGVMVAGLFSLMAASLGYVMAFLGAMGLFLAGATGINAAGVLLMDQARGAPSRSLADAVVYGLLCIPKVIVLGLALLLVALAVFVALALLYLVCRIPLLGPILFVPVFALSVVISGLTLCGLFLCLLLALPAIWEGATITRAIAQALAIARTRLVESLLLLAVVGLMALAVGAIVFGVLLVGLVPSIGMSVALLGGDGPGSPMGMLHGGGGSTYGVAASIGAGLLWALAGSLPWLVFLLGLNLAYLRVVENLDVGAAEAALRSRLDAAKRHATDLGHRAKDAANRARERARHSAAAAQASATAAAPAPAPAPASPPAAEPEPPPESAATPLAAEPADVPTTAPAAKTGTCPQCRSAIARQDMFCGVCGHRLR